ncbi:MAG: type IV pili twitching motility protein PilT, partial [Candidatus Contubernalis sp.]|nr:type IV pili twitching motility protein PilT [Candidatus Contubernalis sp.]
QLSNTLRAVISQQLIRTEDGKGRVLAVELLMDTMAVRNMIREGKTHQIYSVMQTGQSHGMHTMDQALARLFQQGKISRQSALDSCVDKDELNRTMQKF